MPPERLAVVTLASLHPEDSDPYLRCFYPPLREAGLNIAPTFPLTRREIAAHAGQVDILHLHWLHTYFPQSGAFQTRIGAWKFRRLLAIAKQRGMRIVYTAHNLAPHDTRYRRLHLDLAGRVLRMASGVLTHTEYARKQVEELAGRALNVHVLPQMTYEPLVPLASAGAREALNLPADARLLVAFGQARPYKRVVEIIRVAKSLRKQVHLVVAGPCEDPAYRAEVERSAADDPRIHLMLRRLDEQELADLLGAADAIIFSGTGLLSSGSVARALLAGRVLVAPDHPLYREMIPAGGGVFFARSEGNGLPVAIRDALARDAEIAREANLARARVMRRPAWATGLVEWLGDLADGHEER